MQKGATEKQVKHVVKEIEKAGLKAHVSKGTEYTIIGAVGDERKLNQQHLESIEGVERVMPIMSPYKLASREFHPEGTVVEVNGVKIGGKELTIMAGPCSVESEEQLLSIAHAVKKAGAHVLRGSAFKPRTSPYEFQGLGIEGLKLLKKAKKETGLVVETEVMDPRLVEEAAAYVDILRIGARNMQNFDLLKEVGRQKKPVILKNGIACTIKEFLMAAEYIMSEGNRNVILCNRGIRGYEPELRFPMTVDWFPIIKKQSHLPIIADPSHSTGKRDLVAPLSRAAIAAGADGLIVEVHCNPEKALCDGAQSLTTEGFSELMAELKRLAPALGRKL
jgi:3-deoxy-7-phosphoheptulonate synthase